MSLWGFRAIGVIAGKQSKSLLIKGLLFRQNPVQFLKRKTILMSHQVFRYKIFGQTLHLFRAVLSKMQIMQHKSLRLYWTE